MIECSGPIRKLGQFKQKIETKYSIQPNMKLCILEQRMENLPSLSWKAVSLIRFFFVM